MRKMVIGCYLRAFAVVCDALARIAPMTVRRVPGPESVRTRPQTSPPEKVA